MGINGDMKCLVWALSRFAKSSWPSNKGIRLNYSREVQKSGAI